MRQVQSTAVISAFVLCLLWLGGCGATQPSRFYVLSPLPAADAGEPVKQDGEFPLLGIGPIEVPGYLDRPQMVTRAGVNQLDLADFDTWAEPLAENIGRVMVLNLSTLLSTDHLVMYPWGSAPVKYQVAVRVIQFDGETGGSLSLVVRWAVLKSPGRREILVARTSRYTEPIEDSAFASLAASMSRGIGDLSRDIAATVKQIVREQREGDKESTAARADPQPGQPQDPSEQNL